MYGRFIQEEFVIGGNEYAVTFVNKNLTKYLQEVSVPAGGKGHYYNNSRGYSSRSQDSEWYFLGKVLLERKTETTWVAGSGFLTNKLEIILTSEDKNEIDLVRKELSKRLKGFKKKSLESSLAQS